MDVTLADIGLSSGLGSARVMVGLDFRIFPAMTVL